MSGRGADLRNIHAWLWISANQEEIKPISEDNMHEYIRRWSGLRYKLSPRGIVELMMERWLRLDRFLNCYICGVSRGVGLVWRFFVETSDATSLFR
jgi:hypothetical protein